MSIFPKGSKNPIELLDLAYRIHKTARKLEEPFLSLEPTAKAVAKLNRGHCSKGVVRFLFPWVWCSCARARSGPPSASSP